MQYTILVTIDDEVYTASKNVLDEELEGELQHLTRKHEYKNVCRFEIIEEELEKSIATELI